MMNTVTRITTPADETTRPLEYASHCLWADALGLAHLIRTAHPAELDAVRDELIEAANMIMAAAGVKQ